VLLNRDFSGTPRLSAALIETSWYLLYGYVINKYRVFRAQADWTFILPPELPMKELRHLPRKIPPEAYQTSQYVVPRGGIFIGKWRSTFAGSSDGKMSVQSDCALNILYVCVCPQIGYTHRTDTVQLGIYPCRCILAQFPFMRNGSKYMSSKCCPKISIFWDITSCSPLKVDRRFGGTCRLHLQIEE
jgi:hypothetical protein